MNRSTNIIIAASSSWLDMDVYLSSISNCNISFIKEIAELNISALKKIKPEYIFFPHWSYIIPNEIYENFNCVIFHMTDLPYGRGGSPLQNLIKRKIKQTKISAIQCIKELDAGPIYLKRSLELSGSAQEIYIRASQVIIEMIKEIISKEIQPREQVGDVVKFERRKPEQSEISRITNLEDMYDHIRMLDADGYPRAFINRDGVNYQFSKAKLIEGGAIRAEVELRLINDSK